MDELRREIDRLDRAIRDLLNQRARCVLEVGRLKAESGMPVYDPQREGEILAAVGRGNSGPLSTEAMRRLFERILDESRGLERSLSAKAAGDPPPSPESE